MTSPLAACRNSSAAAQTAANSSPRQRNSRTMSDSPSVLPAPALARMAETSPAIGGRTLPSGMVWKRGPRSGRPFVGARPAIGVDAAQQRGPQRGIDPCIRAAGESRIDRQSFDQLLAGRIRGALERVQMRPRRLRIDVIRRDRRHAAPIVDARIDQARQRVRTEIGRSLDVHRRRKQQSRDRNRPQVVREAWRRPMLPSEFRASAGNSG